MEADRALPHNMEAEMSVLGAMILEADSTMDMLEMLEAEYFYRQDHREIFSAIMELNQENMPTDLLTLEDKLESMGVLKKVGGLEYLTNLASRVPSTANARHYARIVIDQAKRRMLVKSGAAILTAAYDREDVDEIIDMAERDILEINKRHDNDVTHAKEAAMSAIRQLEERCRNKGNISGLPTGFVDLDYKLGGLQKGDLIIIAARPSMGKTSLAENMATFVSCRKRIPTVFFSMEMPKEKIINRIFSGQGLIENQKIRLGTLEDEDWKKIVPVCNELMDGKLIIDDTPNVRAVDIKAKCRRIKNRYGGLGLVVVDHLTEMWRPRKRAPNEEHEENVRALKRIARDLQCPVILLQQLNRGPESRADHRPMLGDLKETGASEEVADIVMFIYRDDYYNPDTQKKNIAEIIIAKGRDHGTGTVELAWLGNYTRFMSLDKVRK